jgi:DNA-directed RNA polymerase specialized sigma24 family protein
MRNKELEQYRSLKREVEILEKELHKITHQSPYSMTFNGMPRSGKIADKTGEIAALVADIEVMLKDRKYKCLYLRKKIERFVDSIEDSETRIIVRLRAIDNLSWQDIAIKLGKSDRAYPKRRYYRVVKN